QAEDGIRDFHVTGVQTCALPILAEHEGVPVVRVDLTPIYDQLLAALETAVSPADVAAPEQRVRLTRANLKPRLRMATLYYIANLHNYLVVATGNRSELHVGYCTKYGDTGDILPLGGLVKRQVYALARYLGLPEQLLQRPPKIGRASCREPAAIPGPAQAC